MPSAQPNRSEPTRSPKSLRRHTRAAIRPDGPPDEDARLGQRENSGCSPATSAQGGRVEGLRRIGGETAEHPDIAIAGDRVAVVWKEFDGEKSQLHAMVSDDNGTKWRESALAATAYRKAAS